MTTYRNDFEPVELLGKGPLTDRFVLVRGGVWTATHHRQEYLVFADTLKFRADDQEHPLDVREMKGPLVQIVTQAGWQWRGRLLPMPATLRHRTG